MSPDDSYGDSLSCSVDVALPQGRYGSCRLCSCDEWYSRDAKVNVILDSWLQLMDGAQQASTYVEEIKIISQACLSWVRTEYALSNVAICWSNSASVTSVCVVNLASIWILANERRVAIVVLRYARAIKSSISGASIWRNRCKCDCAQHTKFKVTYPKYHPVLCTSNVLQSCYPIREMLEVGISGNTFESVGFWD